MNLADKIVMKVRPPMPENPNQVGVVRERFPTRTPSGMGVRQIAAQTAPIVETGADAARRTCPKPELA